ncbi:hypothetical protein NIES4075_15740 [Tolypothrix sp. NIES-4075]|uniref:hypothetical protein n=1 Tax=Tolypothrix sp. NIES-4075 TaxID=2005459 RepID=UPI000B5CE49E|nr:hypothetical protein [Tolypothrix sp. NIES-4075]GAX40608.1 hypothetical protein NIES4075_15740 [Tolypothrix sp. NIES-4075]
MEKFPSKLLDGLQYVSRKRFGSFLGSGTTFGACEAGSITINAPNSVTLNDSSQITTATQGTGNAGNLRIDTGKLVVRDGARNCLLTKNLRNYTYIPRFWLDKQRQQELHKYRNESFYDAKMVCK